VKGIYGAHKLKQLARQTPCRIVVGASHIYQRGWIPTEIEFLNLLQPGDWKKYFRDNSIDIILAEHVWEHLTTEQGVLAARVCYQYIKPGGHVRAAVPDGLHPDSEYITWVKPHGSGPGADDHKVLYTYKTFKAIFEAAGFKVDLLEYFDEQGVFHSRPWHPADGMIHRSKMFDERNRSGALRYTSIILDAKK
jgi:predicted SAM-dependent methyltransferase